MKSELSDFEQKEGYAWRRARIMKMLHDEKRLCQRENRRFQGLTYNQLRNRFLMEDGRVGTVGNRIRELRKLGWVVTVEGEDGLKHVYPKDGDD